MDYKAESRFVMSILLIIFMLWLAISRMDFESALVTEEISKDHYRKAVLLCVNQAHGNHDRVAFVLDNTIINMKCENFGPAGRVM